MRARILVVDDEPQIGRLLKTTLGTRGYDVRGAGNGPVALELLASWRPDLILLDLGLPGCDVVICRAPWLMRKLLGALAGPFVASCYLHPGEKKDGS